MTTKHILLTALVLLAFSGNVAAKKDVTATYLQNAQLTSLNGWSYGDNGYNYTDWQTNGDVPVIEFYNAWSANAGAPIGTTRNFHFTQTVTLPAGFYRLAVNAFYREGNGNGTNSKAYIFAGDKQQYIVGLPASGVASYTGSSDLYKAANAFSRGDFSNEFDFRLTEQQTITIGFRGYIDTYCSWCILGPVTLYQYTEDEYADELHEEQRQLMLRALERFEDDYNLADGTDYSRQTMSAEAWTTLIEKVNAVSLAVDDASQAANYSSLCAALTQQMDATDASLRLFAGYRAMLEGVGPVVGGSSADAYSSASNMDSDATLTSAVDGLNAAFLGYQAFAASDINMAPFLGDNLDFSAAEGSELSTDNGNAIHNIQGWTVEFSDADSWSVLRTDHSDNMGKLYIRKNWGDAATTLKVSKQRMLPVGKYTLSLSWNSNLANMTNLSQFRLGSAATTIGEATTEAKTLTYSFEVTDVATPFDLVIGFRKKNSGNTPAQIIVDDIVLTAAAPSAAELAANCLRRDYDPAALWFDATDSKYAAARNVEVSPSAANQIIKAAAADQFSGLTKNVVVDGLCDNFVIADGSPLEVREAFTATQAVYSREMNNTWGTIIMPFALTSDAGVQLYALKSAQDETMTFRAVDGVAANTAATFKKLTTDKLAISVGNVDVVRTTDAQGSCITAADWSAEGCYTARSLTDYAGLYYIADNTFYAADGTLVLNPFRAVFRYSGSNPVKAFGISVDDADAVHEIVDGRPEGSKLYDLGGRLLNEPRRTGIYISKGKKLVIK